MIWALPGFLGQASDWDFIRGPLRQRLTLELKGVEFFTQPTTQMSYGDWASHFNAQVRASDLEPILMGYSFGARMALNTLIENPKLYKAAILVSPSLGLSGRTALERIDSDEALAQRFLTDDWISLLEFWNSQAIFGNAANLKIDIFARDEGFYSRKALAHALRVWSQGRQDSLLSRLHEITCPVLWICGQNDLKYREIMGFAHPQFNRVHTLTIGGAGHRVPWEAPKEFIDQSLSFLSEVFRSKKRIYD